MLKEIYNDIWSLIDPALYALYATLMFAVWIAIF